MPLDLAKTIKERTEGSGKPIVIKRAEGIRRITLHQRGAWKTVDGKKVFLGDGEYDEIFENLGMATKKGNANNLVPIFLDISRLIKNGDLALTEEAETRMEEESQPQPMGEPEVEEEEDGDNEEEETEEESEEEEEETEEEDD